MVLNPAGDEVVQVSHIRLSTDPERLTQESNTRSVDRLLGLEVQSVSVVDGLSRVPLVGDSQTRRVCSDGLERLVRVWAASGNDELRCNGVGLGGAESQLEGGCK